MDNWEKFNETSISVKEGFYSNLNIECITDGEFRHMEKVWKDFEIENKFHYHDLYVQSIYIVYIILYFYSIYMSNALLLPDVLEHLWNACIKTWNLDPFCFLTAPGLA